MNENTNTNTETNAKTEAVEPVKTDNVASKKEEVNKPVKVKKKSKAGTIFLLFILLGLISLMIVEMYYLDQASLLPKGVTNLEEVSQKKKKTDKIYDSEKVINDINPNVKAIILNYLYSDSKDSYQAYVNNLPNDKKLYLSGLFETSYIPLNKLVTQSEDLFGFKLTLEGEDVKSQDKNPILIYTYEKKNKAFLKDDKIKDYTFNLFNNKRDFKVMEYDDYVGDKENFTITCYGLSSFDDGKTKSFVNTRFTFLDKLSYEELEAKLPDLYADQKENFDKITYTFTLKRNKLYVTNVKLGD